MLVLVRRGIRWVLVLVLLGAGLAIADPPTPLLAEARPVDWWFVFKFNTASFPQCGGVPKGPRVCPFGGTPPLYIIDKKNYQYSQQFVYASSDAQTLQKGNGCVGETTDDPIGATFTEIYTKPHFFVVWNDQFHDHPKMKACGATAKFCGAGWGHSKGVLVWDDSGEGMVMQVSTPSWPGSGSQDHRRKLDGNTLGCVADNDVLVSQHFFALKLTKDDVVQVLQAMQNASVVTDIKDPSLVNNGGPVDIQSLVETLGTISDSTAFTDAPLSSGVELISKPSKLHVPPWQFVSSVLGGVSIRTATWWNQSKIYTTTAGKKPGCWDSSLTTVPGKVEIALSGEWDGTTFGLKGSAHPDFNHAKVAHTLFHGKHLSIFGDMNQEGTLKSSGKDNCAIHQNARGGLFFVLDDEQLYGSLTQLLGGDTAPTKAPPKPPK